MILNGWLFVSIIKTFFWLLIYLKTRWSNDKNHPFTKRRVSLWNLYSLLPDRCPNTCRLTRWKLSFQQITNTSSCQCLKDGLTCQLGLAPASLCLEENTSMESRTSSMCDFYHPILRVNISLMKKKKQEKTINSNNCFFIHNFYVTNNSLVAEILCKFHMWKSDI